MTATFWTFCSRLLISLFKNWQKEPWQGKTLQMLLSTQENKTSQRKRRGLVQSGLKVSTNNSSGYFFIIEANIARIFVGIKPLLNWSFGYKTFFVINSQSHFFIMILPSCTCTDENWPKICKHKSTSNFAAFRQDGHLYKRGRLSRFRPAGVA